MSEFKDMSNDYLKKMYVPNVYQPSIHAIDFAKLKAHGITVISFDIDDTIAPSSVLKNPPKSTIVKFAELKEMGFKLILLTNHRSKKRAEHYEKVLGIPCIAKAQKPSTTNFEKIQTFFNVKKEQMAHVGNSMTRDVAGGNSFGATTCLVRDMGMAAEIGNKIRGNLGVKSSGQKLRKVMLKRDIWRKHHKYEDGDQYYQLGETPKYQRGE